MAADFFATGEFPAFRTAFFLPAVEVFVALPFDDLPAFLARFRVFLAKVNPPNDDAAARTVHRTPSNVVRRGYVVCVHRMS